MFKAYILVKAAPGKESEVLDRVKKMKPVAEAELVYGEYDLILKTQMKLPESLDDFVFNTLRQINGVISTTTCICAGSIPR
ncbi:MAG: Lrp/AsnC ligand binding domain-containing protein [Candidatus Hodarchaeota archaeon]